MSTDHHCCNLCGDLEGQARPGRLGRYRVTCDDCESRRGSHLVKTANGYANKASESHRTLVTV
ncbi:MAG: hypothetical protein RIB98_03480 [Acidimicrobiales bacterium]